MSKELRPSGHYWVHQKDAKRKTIAYCMDNADWLLIGTTRVAIDADFDWIGKG